VTNPQASTQVKAQLPDGAHIGGAHLRVIDLNRALGFYRDILGFSVTEQEETHAALAAAPGEAPILRLTQHPGATRKPQRSTGLYHVAILMPDRPALARILRRLSVRGYQLGGASDHLVSEALYLSDLDGNGLEIYRDRPRAEWRWNGDKVALATDPLDLNGLAAEANTDSGVAPGTVIGHVHLHVSDLKRAEDFYSGLLGFTVMQRDYPGALFIAAGGYHHHLGLNIWAGRMPPPASAVGLENFTVAIPGEAAWQQAVERTGAVVEGNHATATDPDGNRIVLQKV
jgi:catechol 2,3-dioxygenase